MTATPTKPVPQGDYVPARRSGKLIVTAGMTPRTEGRLMFSGPVLAGDPLERHEDAVILACANALAAVRDVLGDGEDLDGILAMTVYIAAEVGFTAHSQLADFASAFLRCELGDAAVCSRTAVGVATLPGGAPIEIQLMAAVK